MTSAMVEAPLTAPLVLTVAVLVRLLASGSVAL